MNFYQEYLKGKEGKNFGLPTGLPPLDRAIDGVQKKMIYGIGAAPKVGKTTLVDYAFVLNPYLYSLQNPDVEIEWIYYSYEIDRVRKEFKYASFFLHHDHNLSTFEHNGKIYQVSPRYLMGRLKDDQDNVIIVKPDHEELLRTVYLERIIPLFGEYDINGKKIRAGKIDFIEDRDNPTGIRNYLLDFAAKNGKFVYEEYVIQGKKKQRITGYNADNPDKFVIIVTDHIRKLKYERNYTLKQNVDKLIEYQVELRNWCHWSFVDICHLNRNMSNVDRVKYQKSTLYPTGEDFKDTGNLSEEADIILTMMDANDEKFNLKEHFKLELRDEDDNKLYPNYRSIHLVESRDTDCPQHLQTNMYGNINLFEPI